ncbi:phage tail length tape measure family protein [Desulfosporosinus sp. SB140]|uniref:phage tail length tape measure family protein n=1 Tax=Desulfosporosinus paludis TaxID=3115649 RepID=UPI00388DD16D
MSSSYEILLEIAGKLSPSLNTSLSGASKTLSGIQKTSDKVTGGVSKGFGSLTKVIAGAGAAIGVSMGFKTMMDAASNTQNTTKQLETVLKSTGGAAGITEQAALNLAGSLSNVTTFSKNAVLGSENLLLTFTKIGKDVMPDATETVLNMSQALGQDTKSSAIQLGKALQDPISGVSALQRVGVTFNEQQKNQIKTLVESGKTMDAQKLILKELGTEFGGSARAAGQTFSGQMEIAKNKITGVMGSIGLALMPTIQNLLPKLMDGLGKVANFITTHQPDIQKLASTISSTGQAVLNDVLPVAKNLFNFITNHGEASKNIVLGLGAAFVGFKAISGTIGVVKGVQDAIGGVGKAITFLKDSQILQNAAQLASNAATLIGTGISKAAAAAQLLFNAALDANPIGLVVIGIGGLIAAGVALYKNWDTVTAALKTAWVDIENFFTGGVNKVIDLIDSLIGGLNKIPGVNIPMIQKIGLNVSGNTTADGMKAAHNALGTDNWRGGLTWVGEKGPELINLAKGAQVIPNNKSRGLAASLSEGKSGGISQGAGNNNSGGNNFTYSPVFNIGAGANVQDFKQAASDAQREWETRMQTWQRNQRRVSFAQ